MKVLSLRDGVAAGMISKGDLLWNEEISLEEGIEVIAVKDGKRFSLLRGNSIAWAYNQTSAIHKIGFFEKKKPSGVTIYAYRSHLKGWVGFGGKDSGMIYKDLETGLDYRMKGFAEYVYRINDFDAIIQELNRSENGELSEVELSALWRGATGDLVNIMKNEIGQACKKYAYGELQTHYAEIGNLITKKFNTQSVGSGVEIISFSIGSLGLEGVAEERKSELDEALFQKTLDKIKQD